MMMPAIVKSNHKKLSVVITLVITLIIITPLCGWMFYCGCTWPWAGLDSYCNIHSSGQRDQCPWCVLAFGYLFAGVPVLIGNLCAWYGNSVLFVLSNKTAISSSEFYFTTVAIIVNVMIGLIVFIVLALFSGWLAAWITDYPYFVFNYS